MTNEVKRGRKKKEILEEDELHSFEHFQRFLQQRVSALTGKLTENESKICKDFLIGKNEDDFTVSQKMLRFKRYILKKPLTQEDCTYFIDLDDKGTKPSKKRKLTKMSICKIEQRCMPKLFIALKKSFGKNLTSNELKDAMLSMLSHRENAKIIDWKAKSKEAF